MVASGFSKVSGTLLEDEEDGRQATFQTARTAYDAAQTAYNQQGNSADVLRRFEEAEQVLEPLMQCGGLMGLREKELECLLKGRLHRAVIMAHIEELSDRWAKVKSLADDVLQYDFNNCHARWLRGLSLLNGSRQRSEAHDEMKRAVECARASGKDSEARTWEAEIKAAFEDEDVVESSASDAAASLDTSREVSGATASSSTPAASDSKPRGKTSGQTIQKGFFNRRSQKAAASDVAATKSESSPAPEPPASSSAGGGSGGSAGSSAAAGSVSSAAVHAQRDLQLEEQTRELVELRQQLADMREKQKATRQRQLGWQEDLQAQLEAMVAEFGEDLHKSAQQLSTNSARGAMDDLKAAVSELKERMQSDRSWAEKGHQKFLDCATEVLTLREMTSREFKERQDMSRQQVAEVKELAKRLEDVKPSLKVLKERVKIKASAEEEPDLPRMVEQSMRFKALPASVKFQALLNDATMLRLMAFAAGLGMLLMLGVFIEAFGYFKCRLVCTR